MSPEPQALPGTALIPRYSCEHEVTVAGSRTAQRYVIDVIGEAVYGAPAAACWMLSRAYGIAARLTDPTAAEPIATATAGVFAEALDALSTGYGYGLEIATAEGTHTLRVRQPQPVGPHHDHERELRTPLGPSSAAHRRIQAVAAFQQTAQHMSTRPPLLDRVSAAAGHPTTA